MYWGMYLQADLTVMVVAGTLGVLIWVALFLTSRRRPTRNFAPAGGPASS